MLAPCRRIVVRLVAASLTGLLAASLSSCAPSEEESAYLARKALLLRQNQGIRELIVEAESGSLVPTGRFLVGLDEVVVASLLRSQLPLERPVRVRRGQRCTAFLRMQPSRDLVTWRLDGGPEHSTFHGLLLDPADLARARPDHRPRLHPRGMALAAALDLCRRGWTVARIRAALVRRFPVQFADEDHAGAFLVALLGEVEA